MRSPSSSALTYCLTLALAVASGSCGASRDGSEELPQSLLESDSMGVRAADTATTGTLARDELTESSGVAASARQPGVLFTINDSGNEPLLYGIDSTGADRGVWRVTGATNDDWEAIAVGPCGNAAHESAAPPDTSSCVYIGDTGDNEARRTRRTLYRLPEPTARGADVVGSTSRAERLVYTYSDGPHDVEAMYVAPDGAVFLISKRPSKSAAGGRRPALVFHLPAAAWGASTIASAELVDSLSIVPGSAFGRMITDAALAPDNRHLAVRTYTQVFLFETDTLTGRVNSQLAPAICNLSGLSIEGEGVTWSDAAGILLLTSEGRHAPVHRVRCPLPSRAR